jgi:hypothetical protein
VTGVITGIDQHAGRVAITIGSDDGIASGEVLHLFRGDAKSCYLGKIHINSVQNDSATGQIISRVCGMAIREGDGVAHLTWVKRRVRMCGYALRSQEPPKSKRSGAIGDP